MEAAASSDSALLERLAERAGIEPFFYDIWGQRYDITAETKAALLAAMGIPASTPEEIAAGAEALAAAPWRRLAPPVLVLGDQEPLEVPLCVAAGSAQAELHWTLTAEGGATQQGRTPLAELPVEAGAEIDGRPMVRRRLHLPLRLGWGYHRLALTLGGQSAELALIVAPDRCLTPDTVLGGQRGWGLGVQLYGVRSAGNWGMGDFTDLARLGRLAAEAGADTVGLNPLHALFPADPNHYSPYSPSHRGFLDILYIDPLAVPELAGCPEARDLIGGPDFQSALAAAREAELVDYAAVAALKRPVLELCYATFRAQHLDRADSGPRARAFRAFQHEMGAELRQLALFEALHEHFYAQDPFQWSWRQWPEPFQRPDSPEVTAFAATQAERVEFFEYLQWLADEQLAAAAAAAREAGLALGFYRDLAVGAHPGGAAAWADQHVIAANAGVGAPPDQFNLHGQSWGLAPLSPLALFEAAYRPFIAMVRANMRHAGVLRIDHVMALQHLYWIPPAGGIGAYVQYPLRDLVRILALESQRNRCVVIGEDLGTVPDGFRPAMARAGVLSCRVLYFERNHDGQFLPPEVWPESALVVATTHDLATLKGFWNGVDLERRGALGLYPTPEMERQEHENRGHDRWRLLEALARAGVLPDHLQPRHGVLPRFDETLVTAIYRWLARTPGRLLMVQIEDLLGEAEQPNLPGTVDQHPNWRRRLPLTPDQIARLPQLATLAAAIAAERG